jgi:hypothetical protein
MSAAARRRLAPFLVYVCAFHLTWIAWPYLVYPRQIGRQRCDAFNE